MVDRLLRSRHGVGFIALLLTWGALASDLSTQDQNERQARTSAASDGASAAPKEFRTPDGRPDLQGRWNFATVTPWERPEGTPLHFSDEKEARELEQELAEERSVDARPSDGSVGAYNRFWQASGSELVWVNGVARTSLVVDPPDGRRPPFTAEGKKRLEEVLAQEERAARAEDRSAEERCILGFNTGPPLNPGNYGNTLEIIQNGDYVALITEHVHAARIFPVDGRPHTGVRQWWGDSVARWEGEVLVVETTNFLNRTGVTKPNLRGGLGKRAHLVERLRRLDAGTILYSFTITDPDMWTKPWTMEFTFIRKDDEPVLEYACHERNDAIPNILSGARAEEKR